MSVEWSHVRRNLGAVSSFRIASVSGGRLEYCRNRGIRRFFKGDMKNSSTTQTSHLLCTTVGRTMNPCRPQLYIVWTTSDGPKKYGFSTMNGIPGTILSRLCTHSGFAYSLSSCRDNLWRGSPLFGCGVHMTPRKSAATNSPRIE